jgi:hypothetical protein
LARGHGPADDRQRTEEWYVFLALQAKEGLPIACHDDDPDFLMNVDGSWLGVEVSRFHTAEETTSRLRSEVLLRARTIYQKARPSEPLALSVIWLDVDLVRRDRRALGMRLAAFAEESAANRPDLGDVDMGYDELLHGGLADVFARIHFWRLPAGMANIWSDWAMTYPYTTPALVEARFRDKERRIGNYRIKCSAVWLVIYNLWGKLALDDDRLLAHTYETEFDRVYLFNAMVPPVQLACIKPGPG